MNLAHFEEVSVIDLTTKEKAALTSGKSVWHMNGVPRLNIPSFMITDGPHGLRKAVRDDSIDLDVDVPATCFPPAAGMASSWNPEIARMVGVAMAEECIQEHVAVILGPGVNIKRNPLGGRSFEYWSEDPYLAGHEAIGIVQGVQSLGIGTSLKHFAANNQETDRLRINARVSERALREIYFPAFEYIVQTAQPWTVMCSYNRINGTYSSQNHWLLTDMLRKEWGFRGAVVSDWGAVHDRIAALKAGLNLEMPPTDTDTQIAAAVNQGIVSRHQLDAMAQGVLNVIAQAQPAMSQDNYHYDIDAHHKIARQAAQESIVLLKNEDHILPITPNNTSIAVIGEFAHMPRYQGGGSSYITPTKLSSFLDALKQRGIHADFAPGFTLDDGPQDRALTHDALQAATHADVVLMFLGLPAPMESEGFDRTSFTLPTKQLELLQAVAAHNPNVVVVLSNGSAVSMVPWRDQAQGIIEGWLLGQAGGDALADIIFGDVSPSGKLAQTLPLDINDDPSMLNWPGEEQHVDYGEGVFVGYRYYDTMHKEVAYPFGYGLTYSMFAISDVQATATEHNTARVSATVTNTGAVEAAEVVQVYVAPPPSRVARPVHELKGFTKVTLKPGESTNVTIMLDARAFAYWSELLNDWCVEAGTYTIEVGNSSRDIAGTATLELAGDATRMVLSEESTFAEWNNDPIGGPILHDALEEFGALMGHDVIPDSTVVHMFLNDMPMHSLGMIIGAPARPLIARIMAQYRTTQPDQSD